MHKGHTITQAHIFEILFAEANILAIAVESAFWRVTPYRTDSAFGLVVLKNHSVLVILISAHIYVDKTKLKRFEVNTSLLHRVT